MESRVRSQKAISLSSGEAEFVAMVGGCSDGLLIRHLWTKMTNEECEMKVRSDSSAARSMVQRPGIGRVRHMDAALLWIQQKEQDKILVVSPIPTELNTADIGTKGLTRSRLFGLLFMLKMIDGAGDRVGHEEYKELESRERMRKGTQKVLKNKNLHVGLIWLLSNLESAAGMKTEEANDEEGDNWKWLWLLCATIGALSLVEWVRQYLFIVDAFKKLNRKFEKYMNGEESTKEKETQSDEGNDLQAENEELQTKVFQLDLYIEELEQTIQQTREQRDIALAECQLALKHGEKMMRRSSKYRVCQYGKRLHFHDRCPHFVRAAEVHYCTVCLNGEGVSDSAIPPTVHG